MPRGHVMISTRYPMPGATKTQLVLAAQMRAAIGPAEDGSCWLLA